MTDFRELCAELVTELDGWCGTYHDTVNSQSIIDRARAALTESDTEGPTDEELDNVMFRAIWECTDADNLTNDEMDRLKARAVLARWGNG